MNKGSIFFALFALASTVLSELTLKDNIYAVKDKNYEEFFELARSRNATICIKFQSPMCQHCQELKPTFIEVAKAMENDPDGTYIFGDVNILTQEELGKHFSIEALPTIMVFAPINDYLPSEYDGPRTKLAIVTGIETASGLTIRELTDYKDFQNRLELRDENILLGIFKDEKSSLFEKIKQIKEEFPFIRTYYTLNVDDFKKNLKLGDGEEFILKIHNKKLLDPNDEMFVKYAEDKYPSFRDFVIEEYPYAIDFKTDKVNMIFAERKRPEAVLFTPFANRTEKVLSLAKQMKPLAFKYKGKFNMYIEDSETRTAKLHKFNCNATYIIFDIDKEDTKYRYTEKLFNDEIDVNDLIEFTQTALDKKAPKYIRSAEFNKDDLSLPVVTVIADSYNEVVKDPTKHVFLRFYDKMVQRFSDQFAMRTEWYKVGRHYLSAQREDLIIAEIEVKDNDVPKYFLRSMAEKSQYYFLFKKDDKDKPIPYDGEVNAEKLIKFLEGHIGANTRDKQEL